MADDPCGWAHHRTHHFHLAVFLKGSLRSPQGSWIISNVFPIAALFQGSVALTTPTFCCVGVVRTLLVEWVNIRNRWRISQVKLQLKNVIIPMNCVEWSYRNCWRWELWSMRMDWGKETVRAYSFGRWRGTAWIERHAFRVSRQHRLYCHVT